MKQKFHLVYFLSFLFLLSLPAFSSDNLNLSSLYHRGGGVHLPIEDYPHGKEFTLGMLVYNDQVFSVTLKKSRSFASSDFTLYFYEGSKNRKHIAYMLGRKGFDPEIKFIGMMIEEKWRGKGLARPFLKFFILMTDYFNCPMITGKMEKPALAKILSEYGFEPCEQSGEIFLDRSREGSTYGYYSENVDYTEKFLKSQYLHRLTDRPEKCETVYVQTPYEFTSDISELVNSLSKVETWIEFFGH